MKGMRNVSVDARDETIQLSPTRCKIIARSAKKETEAEKVRSKRRVRYITTASLKGVLCEIGFISERWIVCHLRFAIDFGHQVQHYKTVHPYIASHIEKFKSRNAPRDEGMLNLKTNLFDAKYTRVFHDTGSKTKVMQLKLSNMQQGLRDHDLQRHRVSIVLEVIVSGQMF